MARSFACGVSTFFIFMWASDTNTGTPTKFEMDKFLKIVSACAVVWVCFLGVSLADVNLRSCVTYTNSQLPQPTVAKWRLINHVFLRLEVIAIGGDYW